MFSQFLYNFISVTAADRDLMIFLGLKLPINVFPMFFSPLSPS